MSSTRSPLHQKPRCACVGCNEYCQPAQFLCLRHYRMLPKYLRDGLYKRPPHSTHMAALRFLRDQGEFKGKEAPDA